MIRKITNEDINSVMTIWMKGNLKYQYFIDYNKWLLEFNSFKEKLLNKYKTYVYLDEKIKNSENQNEILGFVSIDGNEVKAIYIKLQERNNGIGKSLIHYIMKNKKELSVYEKNTQAILFFNHLGFRNIKIQIDENTNQKEYIMRWKSEWESKIFSKE